jgi:hypothetical protein
MVDAIECQLQRLGTWKWRAHRRGRQDFYDGSRGRRWSNHQCWSLLVNLRSRQHGYLAFNNQIGNDSENRHSRERNTQAAGDSELEDSPPGRIGGPQNPGRYHAPVKFSKGRDKRPEPVLIYDNPRPR